MNIVELKDKKISELTQMAKKFKIEGAAGLRKQELIFALLLGVIDVILVRDCRDRQFGRINRLTIVDFVV